MAVPLFSITLGPGLVLKAVRSWIVAAAAHAPRRNHSLRSSSGRSSQGGTSPVVSFACPACSLRAILLTALRSSVVFVMSIDTLSNPTLNMTYHAPKQMGEP